MERPVNRIREKADQKSDEYFQRLLFYEKGKPHWRHYAFLTRTGYQFNIRLRYHLYDMKNKKPSARTLMESDKNVDLMSLKMDRNEVEKYLRMVSIKERIPEPYVKVYSYIKNLFLRSLNDKDLKYPTFGVLIERIARDQVFLTIMEESMLDKLRDGTTLPIDNPFQPSKTSQYMQMQVEQRHCLETFNDLLWTENEVKQKKVIEELRRVVSEESLEKS